MRLAAICPVYNEEDLLPHFLDFYCRQVDTVLLLDNESTDRTAELARGRANVVVSTFNTENTFNDRMQHEELVKRRGECVGVYDYVLIVDCDEFVLPKGGGTLKECIERQSPADAYGTHGFRMIQGPGEGQYNPSVGLLEQRRWGVEGSRMESKPIIFRPGGRAVFEPGRHYAHGVERRPDIVTPRKAAFYLLHYIAVDEELFVRRRLCRIRRLSEESRRKGFSVHYFSGDDASLRRDFRDLRSNPALQRMLP